MIFLLRDKNLIRTKSDNVYKFETGVDKIRFLIPQTYKETNIADTLCVVQCILPGNKGLYKICNYEEELYKDMLTITVPITTTITKSVEDNKFVDVYLYLMFIEPTEGNTRIAKTVLKSDRGMFQVINNGSLDSASESAFDEIWEHSSMDEIEEKLDELTANKADNLGLTNGILELKSGDTILSTIQLPDDVTWEEWN